MKSLTQNVVRILSFALWTVVLFAALTGLASEPVELAGPLSTPRKNHTAPVNADGRVLVVRGESDLGPLTTAEI